VERGVAAPADLLKAVAKTREAQEKLAKARLPVDESRLVVLRRALEQIDRDSAVKRQDLEQKRGAKRAEVEAARIELANLELEQDQAVIRSPIDGIVTSGDVKVGDVLEPSKPVAEVAEQAGFRFEAAVPSEEVGHLRVGMPVQIKLDAYDYQRYGTLEGTVCFVSPDSGVEGGQKAALYTVKVAVPRDELGRGTYRGRVKLGMAGQAEIVTGQESVLSLLVRRVRRTISLG
jgi:multidrug resistance efflux pump